MASHGRQKKSLILCFDGTGNKFSGTHSDSNIVKIFSMLDRGDPAQCHYYQPGIGTYVETSSLAQKSVFGRIKSAYIKAKDEAIGTSFGEHVMAGYKFLMRYYDAGDDIYFFGFSRGAYTARFLAELLDYIGLLTAGNEEMLRFAWKTFARWQARTESTHEEKQKKKELFVFMKSFRETFSRPIDRIRFIGLFDCVNSVPQFESAWMSRTGRFPYTAKTSARIIRHAVSIDERRTKFRQDLLSSQRQEAPHPQRETPRQGEKEKQKREITLGQGPLDARYRRVSNLRPVDPNDNQQGQQKAQSYLDTDKHSIRSGISSVSINSNTIAAQITNDANDASISDEHDKQDIQEVWFAGQHGDIGGGWGLSKSERRPASDLPLMWMIREARRAGMPMDDHKLEASDVYLDEAQYQINDTHTRGAAPPRLEIDDQPIGLSSPVDAPTALDSKDEGVTTGAGEALAAALPKGGKGFVTTKDMEYLHARTKVHDSLAFGGGLGAGSVVAWQVMEHLPFRRMDLQKDGSWKPISWPLPRGETRDMPVDAVVHGSVIRRMQVDKDYRPGNLIVGGGGRGVRVAPPSAGTGQWKVVREEGDLLGEVFIKVIPERKDGEETNGAT